MMFKVGKYYDDENNYSTHSIQANSKKQWRMRKYVLVLNAYHTYIGDYSHLWLCDRLSERERERQKKIYRERVV